MLEKEKINLLEEMLELDEGTLNDQMSLDEVENWDSMAAITLIALIDEKFGKQLTGAQIKKFDKVKDILDYMG